jgi:hypothetical protein
MKKVLITLTAVLTLMSCSKEEMTETQEVNFNFTQAFTGEYLNSETFIDGELSTTCATTWDFNDNNTMRIDRVLPCVDGTASSGLSQFTFDIDNLYVTMGGNTASYPYTEDANGDLTLTLLTGNFEIIYKLTR